MDLIEIVQSFYEQIGNMIKEQGTCNQVTIWTGDFNLVLNPDLDTNNYININNPKAREKVLDICEEYNLIDVWRESHPEEKKYTWRTSNGNKQASYIG